MAFYKCEKNIERRILPRIYSSTALFKRKSLDKDRNQIYRVNDLSLTGMGLTLFDGDLHTVVGQEIRGVLRYQREEINILGQVKWVDGQSFGIQFDDDSSKRGRGDLEALLAPESLVREMRPIHHENWQMDMPFGLKSWLRSPSDMQLFIWQNTSSIISSFQWLLFDRLLEWNSYLGLRSGHVDLLPKKSALGFDFSPQQVVFDEKLDLSFKQFINSLLHYLPNQLLSFEDRQFMSLRLK